MRAPKVSEPNLSNRYDFAIKKNEISEETQKILNKYDPEYMSKTLSYLTVPSTKHSTCLHPRRRSSKLSDATTAAFSDSHSAHSTAALENNYDSEVDSSNIKISDFLSATADKRESKIRRDFCGNLRAVP